MYPIPFVVSKNKSNMNIRRVATQNVILFCLISCLCIYYVYQYFKIEELMENIDDEFEKEMHPRMDADENSEPKPLANTVDKHLVYQPNTEVEFPTDIFSSTKIPHIIHVVFRNATIPYGFAHYPRSFYINNPEWEFRFYTFDSGRKLIEKTHPELLLSFDSWTGSPDNDEKRSNMIRHVALYEYGGVTADLDVDNLRSLDIATKKYGCIIPPIPFEHSSVLYNFDLILSTSVMLCRPKHPFFKLLLKRMEIVDGDLKAFDASGDGHITRIYIEYNNLNGTDMRKKHINAKSNSPYFYKGDREEDDEDAVYVPNTQYFTDSINPQLLNKKGTLKECSERDSLQPYLTKRACAEFESRRELRAKRKYAFTSKFWFDIFAKHYTPRVIHIKKIIPKIIL
ncbi:uncharacterized protein LOC132748720 [Ruditapes philippinarum]|uniref:uncharacterized protein LOC132748720 n=1 Tax=Ruditapes philippinarum TaxID=129788 RepID=UPI00295C03AC|nr:uncharacterized protein LOC132748720 [Ruditapes philippinarum]